MPSLTHLLNFGVVPRRCEAQFESRREAPWPQLRDAPRSGAVDGALDLADAEAQLSLFSHTSFHSSVLRYRLTSPHPHPHPLRATPLGMGVGQAVLLACLVLVRVTPSLPPRLA
ncbi:unnamed protein product [Prorocentrum cordatum]|uniref:Uncharacterized protein n=1 Tax=Prorocentrum cordatum TaxID=2364126 RepID=A0ABN9SW96_9DINO|nr:unnamed protein product [Polarella glacialis]